MPAEAVVDASVIGAALFNEAHSARARAFLNAGPRLTAPSLLFAEIASLAAKKVWRSEASEDVGRRALTVLPTLLDTTAPTEPLSPAAFGLAARHRFSAYDALYLALAERNGLKLVTLDFRLIRRAVEAGIGALVMEPPELN